MFDYEEAMRKIEAIVEALVQASAQLNASGSQSIEIPSLLNVFKSSGSTSSKDLRSGFFFGAE